MAEAVAAKDPDVVCAYSDGGRAATTILAEASAIVVVVDVQGDKVEEQR